MALQINMPLPGTPARELLGDISEVVRMLAPENREEIPVTHMAISSVRDFFMDNPAAREVYTITRDFDCTEFTLMKLANDGNGSITLSHVWDFC